MNDPFRDATDSSGACTAAQNGRGERDLVERYGVMDDAYLFAPPEDR